jgi:hypothetical protein
MMPDKMTLYWSGAVVGYLLEPELDMWYITGKWLPTDNETAIQFRNKIQNLTIKDFYNVQDVNEFVWIGLDEAKPNVIFVVIEEDLIRIRRIFTVNPPESW